MAGDDTAAGISAEIAYKLPFTNTEARLKVAVPLGRKKDASELRFSRWRTKRLAKHDGKRDEPPTDGSLHNRATREARVEDMRQARNAKASAWIDRQKTVAKNTLIDLKPTPIVSENITGKMETLIKGYLDDMGNELQDRRDKYHVAEEQLAVFRHEHDLTKRDAIVPDDVFRPITILLIAFLVEGILNGMLFMGASAQGFVGGLLIAFALSFFNVALGLVAGGVGVRNFFHHDKWRKRVGIAIASVFGLLGLALNFFVAHFRDHTEQLMRTLEESGSTAEFSLEQISPSLVASEMFPNPFNLETLPALILLGLGLIVFSLATYEGIYGFSDRYPGFGGYWLKRRKRREAHRVLVTVNRAVLRNVFAGWRVELAAAKTALSAARDATDKVLVFIKEQFNTAEHFQKKVSREANEHISFYREINARTRRRLMKRKSPRVGLAPAYFEDRLEASYDAVNIEDVQQQAQLVASELADNIKEIELIELWMENQYASTKDALVEVETREDKAIQDIRQKANETDDRSSRNVADQTEHPAS